MKNELLRIDYTNVDMPTVLGRDLIQVYKNEQFGEVRMVVEGDSIRRASATGQHGHGGHLRRSSYP